MNSIIIKVSEENATSVLKDKGVIAVPTDTVYGIACLVKYNDCIRRIYRIKERNQLKAIPVLIGNIKQIIQVSRNYYQA